MTDQTTIRVPCEACQREGRILRASAINPHEEVDYGACLDCNGTAYIEVETHPVTLEERWSAEGWDKSGIGYGEATAIWEVIND